MSDDPTQHKSDAKRISLKQEYEVRYWSDRLGVSTEELAAAVREVGSSADAVSRYIRANRGR